VSWKIESGTTDPQKTYSTGGSERQDRGIAWSEYDAKTTRFRVRHDDASSRITTTAGGDFIDSAAAAAGNVVVSLRGRDERDARAGTRRYTSVARTHERCARATSVRACVRRACARVSSSLRRAHGRFACRLLRRRRRSSSRRTPHPPHRLRHVHRLRRLAASATTAAAAAAAAAALPSPPYYGRAYILYARLAAPRGARTAGGRRRGAGGRALYQFRDRKPFSRPTLRFTSHYCEDKLFGAHKRRRAHRRHTHFIAFFFVRRVLLRAATADK